MMFKNIKTRKFALSLLCYSFIALALNSCKSHDVINKNVISVMLESGPGFTTYDSLKTQERGTDFSFKIKLDNNFYISSVSYESYQIANENDFTIVTLEKVMFPTVITIKTTKDFVIYHSDGGLFENGESFYRFGKNENHLLFNTLSGHEILKKDNHYLIGWETLDGSVIGLGSRCDRNIKHLKAKRIKESPIGQFIYDKRDAGIFIKEYIGSEKIVVLPAYIDDLPVIKIEEGAFNNKKIKELYLSPYIKLIEDKSFLECEIENLYFFDNLIGVTNNSFYDSIIKKVHINATRKPRYSGTFYDTFSDKMDYLKEIKDKKKIVLFSGSSTRYGYDSPLLQTYFPQYEVINMGVYAYFSAKIQLDLIANYMLPGDILIDAPEFDAVERQMYENIAFEKRVFNMFESNYDNLKQIDISKYGNFFNSFVGYQHERDTLPVKNYDVSAMHFDDDGNYHDKEIYNLKGDLILERDGEVKEGLISQHRLAYKVGQISDEQFDCFNEVYENMKNKGIKFFFNYAPRNIDSLTTDSTKENRELFERQIKQKVKAPFLSTMDDFLYKADHFYLIDNHLTSEGARKRTIVTANNLLKYYE